MLTLTRAWTNRRDNDGSYALWLHGEEPNGRNWWINAGIAARAGVGLTIVEIISVPDEAAIEKAIADDDQPELWVATDPGAAFALIRTEMERARDAVWAKEYPQHFVVLVEEYERLVAAVENRDPVEEYERRRGVFRSNRKRQA